MKKISVFTLMLASGMAASAQNNPSIGSGADHKPLRTPMEVKTRFGIKGGVNLASLDVDDDNNVTNFNTNNKTTFHAGAFVNIPIGGMFRVQPELLYSRMGSKVDGTPIVGSQTSTDRYELDFDYLTLPVMLQLQTPGGFFVEAGPQISYLITARQDNQLGSDPDIKDAGLVKKTDFAVAGGVGYTSRIGLGIHAGYVYGISNVWNADDAPQESKDREMNNRAIKIGLHYNFGAYK
jgi:hypothetical protein